MIPIRTASEIDAIARAGRLVAEILGELLDAARPGVETRELDQRARAMLAHTGATPLFTGFVPAGKQGPGFPASICVCVNDEVTHGVPGPRVLEAGDLVCIDLGASIDGWCADASRARVVGSAEPSAGADGCSPDASETLQARERLIRDAHSATDAGIAAIAPGVRWSSVADAVRASADRAGCGVVGGYSGHGIGRQLHEPPRAPMFLGPKEDFVLRAGIVLTVEPILVGPARGTSARADGEGRGRPVSLLMRPDGWTVATADGADACQIEQTVAVTDGGSRVLTLRETGRLAT